ncbi:MAG: hypothetical protein KKB31_03215 [Nanoarchaeota archaeon]|nr:hypothetical protein [Nanoarchaeota archaeon]
MVGVDYFIGSKQVFVDFLERIKPEDKIAILTHIDLDGISSALFLEKILESRGHKVEFLDFINYQKGMFDKPIKDLRDKKITKVFLTDINADNFIDEFDKFRREFDSLLIDHHPANSELKNKKNIIKTISNDCIGFVMYEYGRDFFNTEGWEWLLDATLVSEFSFKNKKHMDYLKGKYSGIGEGDPINSEPGKMAITIDYALKYDDDFSRVYNLIRKKDFDSLRKSYSVVNGEFEKLFFKYEKEAEFYSEKRLHFFFCKKPRFNVTSAVITAISKKNKDIYCIAYERSKGFVRLNFRNQGDEEDMNLLVKKGIAGLDGSTGGGHFNAAAAMVKKEDYEKFKENILR